LSVVGFDLLPELVDKAKKYAENCTFYQGDILKPTSSPKNFAQIVTCTGVLSIFDSFECCIDNLIYWEKPGGIIFLHSLFNNYPVDVQVKYNLSRNYGQGVLESGWNIFSKESVSSHLNKLKSKNVIKSFVFHDFEMRREILKKEDIIRSWTQRDENGQYQITNALMLLQPHSVLEIRK
jgi:2-polyprenyl-3-methyl-5-hydroxy-6-metoxy-1,4-benzoquinol methylase